MARRGRNGKWLVGVSADHRKAATLGRSNDGGVAQSLQEVGVSLSRMNMYVPCVSK